MTKNQGIKTILAAVAIQITLGVAYIWSVFQNGIARTIFSGDDRGASLAFSLLLLMMTIGSIVGGKLAAKHSTRIVVFIGGLILAAGFFLSSLVTADYPWMLWITYGVIGGMGMGFTYSTTIACAQKWYPHKRGLVTGIIVASLGFGGVVLTPLVEKLIEAFGGVGEGEQGTFVVLSIIFVVVCSAGSYFLHSPHGEDKAKLAAATAAVTKKQYSPSEMLKTPQFYLIVCTYMLACIGGVMMINFARPIAEVRVTEAGLNETVIFGMGLAALGVMAVTMFNSLGRLTWGMISDKLGRNKVIFILLSGNVILPLLVNTVNGLLVFILIALIGLFYGGIFSNFPALTADLFGVKHVAANYGFVLLGFGIGSNVASQIAGYFAKRARGDDGYIVVSEMFPAFIIASCCSAAAIVLMVILRKLGKEKMSK
ncbi:MAG: OFA family MFS transporter [Oscillospiraceae bacterium]|jgi:OFA family oxalate/formate antiporter-like MFS transporter|nr:OFA family MFS transporter [Oscillospiraceae bacterium]